MAQGVGPEAVVLEDVARHDDEFALRLAGRGADAVERGEALVAHDGARVAGDEVDAEAELPVGGVEEADGRHGGGGAASLREGAGDARGRDERAEKKVADLRKCSESRDAINPPGTPLLVFHPTF